MGGRSGWLCVHAETCGDALAIEHNGDLYSCDHFVYPQHKLGNIADTELGTLVNDPRQRKFGTDKRDKLPQYCRDCEVRFVCNGGCPKSRFLVTPAGDPGLHYLCKGYRSFFNHIAPPMKAMAELYHRQQSPAGVMDLVKRKAIPGYRPRK